MSSVPSNKKDGNMQIDAIILAGGLGKRLWPQSRQKTPKHLLNILGDSSLIYMTIMRTLLLSPHKIVIITSKDFTKDINKEIDKVKSTEEYLKIIEDHDITFSVVEEPEGKNTAPALALGSYILNRGGNENVTAMFPSDHIITNNKFFIQAIKSAYAIAKKGYIATIGIAPTKPATGYGYIETENKKNKKWYTVKSFTEKPDLKTAERYLKKENYYYNSGMLVFKPSELLEEFNKYMPELTREMEKIKDLKLSDPLFDKTLKSIYKSINAESVDYGILEKSKNVAVVPAGFKWSDLGSWESLYDILDKDINMNVSFGNVVNINSQGTFVQGNKKLITLIGAKDLVVVDTEDALLICEKGCTENVKELVDYLQEKGLNKFI